MAAQGATKAAAPVIAQSPWPAWSRSRAAWTSPKSKRILGAGTKDSSYTAAGEVTEGYTWCGDVSRDYLNSPVVEITFVDGKVDIVQPYNIPAN